MDAQTIILSILRFACLAIALWQTGMIVGKFIIRTGEANILGPAIYWSLFALLMGWLS